MGTQEDLFSKDSVKEIVKEAKNIKKPPMLGSSAKIAVEVGKQMEGADVPNVRPTTAYSNILKGSEVERAQGYKGEFEVKGVDPTDKRLVGRITLGGKTVNVPLLENYKNFNEYNKALKKFRKNVLTPLVKQNPKEAMKILTSGSYLDRYAYDMRQGILNNPKLWKKYGVTLDKKGKPKLPMSVINKINKSQGYVFDSLNPKGGLPAGAKVQSKVYRLLRESFNRMGKLLPTELRGMKRVNFNLALNEIDKLWQAGKKTKAIAAVTSLATLLSNGAFGKTLLVAGKASGIPMAAKALSDVFLGTEYTGQDLDSFNEMLGINTGGEPEITINAEDALAYQKKQNMRGGGMMNINEMIRPLGYAEGGFEDRMSMLRRSMVDEENQRMREPDIISVALTLARQEGDTSEENVNLIIDQLTALMPSVTKTMEEELTPLSTQGLKYLFDKMNIMAGKKSDPMLRRDVGFERVD